MIYPRTIYFYLLVASSFLLGSCNHYYYAPNEGNLLPLGEQHDLKASVALGSPSRASGATSSFQLGYSPIKHLGLQTSYFGFRSRQTINGIPHAGDGYITNVAIGTYYTFDIRKDKSKLPDPYRSDKITVDFYVGYAQGEVKNEYSATSFSQFDFNKRYVQAGFHWQNKIIGVDIAFKVGNLDYKTGTARGDIPEDNYDEILAVQQYDTYNFVEPSFRLHFGPKHVRFFATRTWMVSSKLIKVDFIDSTYHLGMAVNIDAFFRKKRGN